MGRLNLIAIAVFLTTGCGASQSAEPTSGGESAADPSSREAPTQGDRGEGSGGPAGDNEFQLSNSDTAGQAHGEHPSEIEATDTHAAMRLFVVSPDTGPIAGIVIKMISPDGGVYYTNETDSQGYAEVLVPVGHRYEMEYLSLGRRNTTAAVEVPTRRNYDLRLTMRYRRVREPREVAGQEPQGLVLEGILFDTGRATIQAESFPRLDRVVEYLTHKPSARIGISGHTDNVGNARANQRLSEGRARAVRDYLIEHGIDGSRVEAVGYGDQRPVASNDNEAGRQQNRRIEAIEL